MIANQGGYSIEVLNKVFVRKKESEIRLKKVEAKHIVEMQCNMETEIGIAKRRKRDFKYGPE